MNSLKWSSFSIFGLLLASLPTRVLAQSDVVSVFVNNQLYEQMTAQETGGVEFLAFNRQIPGVGVYQANIFEADGSVSDVVSITGGFLDFYSNGDNLPILDPFPNAQSFQEQPITRIDVPASNVQITIADEPSSVPEPSSVIGTLAFGALGAGSLLKRFQKKHKAALISGSAQLQAQR